MNEDYPVERIAHVVAYEHPEHGMLLSSWIGETVILWAQYGVGVGTVNMPNPGVWIKRAWVFSETKPDEATGKIIVFVRENP